MRIDPAPSSPLDRRSAGQAVLGLSSLALGLALTYRVLRRRRYSFAGRTAIVTGGSRGLGFELARQLAAAGARVWLVARSSEALERAAAVLREGGASVRTHAADVRNPADMQHLVDLVVATDRRLDVLVNNAGIITVAPFDLARDEDFENSLATHFWGPLHLIRLSLPYLGRDGEGRILNVSSIGGRIGVPHLAAYAAGKFALTGLSETLHAELRPHGVRVTTATPGLMRTGSYVNVSLRGNHAREFQWFTAMGATPLTSMRTDRAAAQMLAALRSGKAKVTPGAPARAAALAAALAPNPTAAVTSVATSLLPDAEDGRDPSHARRGSEVDPGGVKTVLTETTRRRFQQAEPTWA
jgi:NAD(P)-dependent dehydrogenase (short-subunit alcohol dehydrogenase family)